VVGNIHQIEPWEGLWIWASQDCDLVLSGQPRAVARAEHKSRSPNVQWLVRLEATAGDARDTDNYLGVADSAYQIVGPPQIPHFVDLRLISGGAGLAADLRAGEQANLAWDLEVETDLSDAPVSLAWPDLSQVPKGYRLTLYDLDANRAQQMRTTSGYVFNSGSGGIRHFRIEAKNAAAGVLLVANLAAQQTRGATSITYLLSQDAAVSVQIYSLAGNLVRDLAHNVSAVAGENSIVWDGRDDNGRLVPGGTYVCEVAASGEDGQAARASRLLVVAR
jgi:hypothetical protein